ncbi:MAG: hypothetical protein E7000_03510 [Coriobacteriaceae bacterium]|nr:hypothetical protein [Coriobacteriaceae bacterium]
MILDRIRARRQHDEALYEEALQQASENEKRKKAEEAQWGWPEDSGYPAIERALTEEEYELVLPLQNRALCTKASPLLFKDQAALRICDDCKLPLPGRTADAHAYLQAIAQRHYVETAKVYLKRNPQASVIDLGCGLNTTLRQLDNHKLQWYNIDSGNTLSLRTEFGMDTTGRIKNIDADPKEIAWFDKIHYSKRKGMIIIANDELQRWSAWEAKNFLVGVQERFPDTLVMFSCIGGDAGKPSERFRLFDLNAKAVFHAWLDKPSTRVYETSRLPEELSKAPDIAQDIRKQLARCYSHGDQILVDIVF